MKTSIILFILMFSCGSEREQRFEAPVNCKQFDGQQENCRDHGCSAIQAIRQCIRNNQCVIDDDAPIICASHRDRGILSADPYYRKDGDFVIIATDLVSSEYDIWKTCRFGEGDPDFCACYNESDLPDGSCE